LYIQLGKKRLNTWQRIGLTIAEHCPDVLHHRSRYWGTSLE
jgi:hypothetical protein